MPRGYTNGMKMCPPSQLGKKRSAETIKRLQDSHAGEEFSEERKQKISKALIGVFKGSKHPNWKGGKETFNLRLRESKHRRGINKKYTEKYGGKNIPRKFYGQKYRALKKAGGLLLVKTIQLVYEDNIKKYGTLTCYLCLRPILFGKDNLEHKTPLSRNGTNRYENLAIACKTCNCKKGAKTEEEYRKEFLNHD